MWKIICLFSLLARALGAPSGCVQLCDSQGLQSYQNLNCCGLPMVASLNDARNQTNHNDFETPDGALVHKKDGTFVNGNTRGSFNEMSYYKETGGGINPNFGSGFENSFGNLQHSGSNFGTNQKIEDFGSSFQNSFESMFESRSSELRQSVRESLNHLQELKRKGQLQTQECVGSCVPINQQIAEAQQQWSSLKQQMDQMREQLWTQLQQQQQEYQQTYQQYQEQHQQYQQKQQQYQQQQQEYRQQQQQEYRQQQEEEQLRRQQQQQQQQRQQYQYEQHQQHQQHSTIQVNPVPVQPQPLRIVEQVQTVPQQSISKEHYQKWEHSQQTESRPQITTKVTYPVKIINAQQTHGTASANQIYHQGAPSAIQQGTYAQNQMSGTGIQSQAGYDQGGYESQTHGSQTFESQTHGSQTHGYQSHGSQTSEFQGYGTKTQGSQGYGSQGYGSQGYGSQSYGSHGSTYGTHGSLTQGGMSHQGSVGFGSTSGGLLTETIAMGPNPDCNEESHYHQSYTQQRRYKRASLHPGAEDLGQETQRDFDALPVQQTQDFGEPARIQKVSQQEIEALGQQVEDFRHGKVEDFSQKSEDLTQQTQDLTQKSQDFNQESQDLTQKIRGFDDFPQQSGRLELEQELEQHPSQIESLSQQSQDFTQQQTRGFDDFSQIESLPQKTQADFLKPENLEMGQGVQKVGRPTGIEDLTQQSQTVSDFSQQPRGFDQQTVGNLKLDQPAREFRDFNQFPTPVLAPDSHQLGNQRFDGLNQQFNEPLKPAPKPTSRRRNPKPIQLNQDKTSNDDTIFNTDHATENSRHVQAEWDDKVDIQSPSENLRKTGRGDISAENIDSPTDRPLTPHEVSDSQEGYQKSSEKIYHVEDFGQQVQKPGGYFQHVPSVYQDFSQDVQRENRDFSQQVKWEDENLDQQVQKPREGFSQQVEKTGGYFQHVPSVYQDFSQDAQRENRDFSQQVKLGDENLDQQVQKPREGFSYQVQKPGGYFQHVPSEYQDFSQDAQRENRDFSQQVNWGDENLGQQVQNPREGFSQQVEKTLEHFSQQVQKIHQQFSQGIQEKNPHENFSQQQQNLHEDISQQMQTPHEGFSQQVQKTREVFSQQYQNPHKDLTQISDLSSKDITQLPQEPRGGLLRPHQVQGKFTDHSLEKSEQTREISLGNQWHRSHNPSDITNENLQLDAFPEQIQQTHQRRERQQNQERQQTWQAEQTTRKQEKNDRIIFDQQKTQGQLGTWKQQMSREDEVIHGMASKLEFGQSVQNQGSNLQFENEKTKEISLQPRILEAYGGRGPYDPMHGDDLFNGAKLNPSATLPPFIDGDPWDIREKPVTPRVMHEDKVIPLDTKWVFPDAVPTILTHFPTTQTPKPGFWDRVGRRFSTVVEKTKEKAKDIFG